MVAFSSAKDLIPNIFFNFVESWLKKLKSESFHVSSYESIRIDNFDGSQTFSIRNENIFFLWKFEVKVNNFYRNIFPLFFNPSLLQSQIEATPNPGTSTSHLSRFIANYLS